MIRSGGWGDDYKGKVILWRVKKIKENHPILGMGGDGDRGKVVPLGDFFIGLLYNVIVFLYNIVL